MYINTPLSISTVQVSGRAVPRPLKLDAPDNLKAPPSKSFSPRVDGQHFSESGSKFTKLAQSTGAAPDPEVSNPTLIGRLVS
jgi:hypothetical protein